MEGAMLIIACLVSLLITSGVSQNTPMVLGPSTEAIVTIPMIITERPAVESGITTLPKNFTTPQTTMAKPLDAATALPITNLGKSALPKNDDSKRNVNASAVMLQSTSLTALKNSLAPMLGSATLSGNISEKPVTSVPAAQPTNQLSFTNGKTPPLKFTTKEAVTSTRTESTTTNSSYGTRKTQHAENIGSGVPPYWGLIIGCSVVAVGLLLLFLALNHRRCRKHHRRYRPSNSDDYAFSKLLADDL